MSQCIHIVHEHEHIHTDGTCHAHQHGHSYGYGCGPSARLDCLPDDAVHADHEHPGPNTTEIVLRPYRFLTLPRDKTGM